MSEFRSITPEALTDNVFRLIGKDWMLVTSAADTDSLAGGKDYNTMTASWGGTGILWNKPVAFVFIRPQRHTFGFTEENDRLTLSFFDEKYRAALAFCGKESGRNCDKAAECGLTPVSDHTEAGRAVWFDEARLVLKCRKLYADFLRREAALSEIVTCQYSADDWHKMYVCEIEEVLLRD